MGSQLVTENGLDEWVRAHSGDAQRVIVELIYRLVLASCPGPTERRFPLGDSIGQHGADGYLETTIGFLPFVPQGKSFWEIGTNVSARKKATDDYRELTRAVPQEVRSNSSFVFVTPLSGRRGWEYSWKPDAQVKWLETRCMKGEWRSVAVIDGTRLIDWLQQFPTAEVWLAGEMGLPVQEMQTPEQRWAELRAIGEPPLLPEIFLANRDDARAELTKVFGGEIQQLKIDTHFPSQVADFVCAHLAAATGDQHAEAVARCLIVSGSDAWSAICTRRERHILVASFELHEGDADLLERARREGHAVIFGGQPGGIPYSHRISLPNPRVYQLEEALKNAGYRPERARTLARRSDENLGSLLRCLQNLSLTPEWAQGLDATELAIAQLLGAWQENSQADRSIAESVSGKPFREWIGTMREIALRPGTPLTNRNGLWAIRARYETWYELGSRVSDEHLDQLQAAATLVLRERHPRFDLPSDERYFAAVRGKVLAHSDALRRGLAETLALVGSHGKELACSLGKADAVAVLTVRAILAGADWDVWASLNGLLPLLAEAAPGEFLDIVEQALSTTPSPLAGLFIEESSPLIGSNHMGGVLWALETLAWDPEYLMPVVLLLGELAVIGQGKKWGNDPVSSLTTILLPWFPQTCAPVEKRIVAVTALTNQLPDIGWKLLLNILPGAHQTSSGTSKPTWRETTPQEWSEGATRGEYAIQVEAYTEAALNAARTSISRLAELIDRLGDLPLPAQEKMLAHLSSEGITPLPEADKYLLWTKLTTIVGRHRKYAHTEWALPPAHVDKMAAVALCLAPTSLMLRHRKLFSGRDFELFDDEDHDITRREQLLDDRRQQAVSEILASGGLPAVLDFAATVEYPYQVGFALGMLADGDGDRALLPTLLLTEEQALAQVVGNYIRGRYVSNGWAWVDQLPLTEWTPEQVGQFLASLPFVEETWRRVTQFLPGNEALYWTKTRVSPYQARGQGLELAVGYLLTYGRPHAAIHCLYVILHDAKRINSEEGIAALLAAVLTKETDVDGHRIVQVIKALQDDPGTDQNGLFQVEWAYLPLLEQRRDGVAPTLLERRLAEDPDFFCEAIRLIFRSKNEAPTSEPSKPSEERQTIAKNAYRLLRNWKTPPGTLSDGSYDGATLTKWLDRMKASCAESGHLEVAMLMSGHVFVSTPPDPSGLWIHHAAASALNDRDARDMREGYMTELFNSRGVHGYSAGKEEQEIAVKYRTKADEVEAHGYSRLATALRELAISYERDAERERSREL